MNEDYSQGQAGAGMNGASSQGQAGDHLPARPDITTREGTASSIRIPVNALAILGIILSLCIIVGLLAAVKLHLKRKEEASLQRRQRRLDRLEDIGYSSTDFDRLVAERRSPSVTRRNKRRRRKKSFFR